jgi:hypothetical protein
VSNCVVADLVNPYDDKVAAETVESGGEEEEEDGEGSKAK